MKEKDLQSSQQMVEVKGVGSSSAGSDQRTSRIILVAWMINALLSICHARGIERTSRKMFWEKCTFLPIYIFSMIDNTEWACIPHFYYNFYI